MEYTSLAEVDNKVMQIKEILHAIRELRLEEELISHKKIDLLNILEQEACSLYGEAFLPPANFFKVERSIQLFPRRK